MPSLRWHYTTGKGFTRIVESGEIRPASCGIDPGERPAVWFSTLTRWEPTANKLWMNPDGAVISLGMRETRERAGGLVRFGVVPDVAPHGWKEYLRVSGVSPSMARGMARAGRNAGSDPSFWFVSFDAVLRHQWASVEVMDDAGRWVSVESVPGLAPSLSAPLPSLTG